MPGKLGHPGVHSGVRSLAAVSAGCAARSSHSTCQSPLCYLLLFSNFIALLHTHPSNSIFSLKQEAQNLPKYSRCRLPSTENRSTITSLSLLFTPFLVPVRWPLVFLATWPVHVQLSTNTLVSFSGRQFISCPSLGL